MKRFLYLSVAVILAMLFNIEWEWHLPAGSLLTWHGPAGGTSLCVIIITVLFYRSFLYFQDFLISRGYMRCRVRTPFDMLPLIILLPLAFTYIARGTSWVFKWGEGETKMWFYLSILASIFAYQFYLVVKDVAHNAKYGKP
ncbi:MAG: hypothetical protein ABIP97_09050 [Chthoniobacterales bacterium]